MPDTSALSMGASQRKFGTFLGVFTPSVLTILGVIMYLRFGWVVAQSGLAGALLIVLICNAIAFVTALSASAVSTNMRLGTGGEYFLISRSMGLAIGGAIGIPLFLCRALSITLYCFGLAEALSMFWPAQWGVPQVHWVAAGLVILTTAISGKSAAISLKLQLPLMVVVGVSLVALTAGVFSGPIQSPQWFPQSDRLSEKVGFWHVLAVFFPAVTGFAAGIGMSGDLRDPQKSIPRGTMFATVVGFLVYMTVPVLLSITGKVEVEDLANIDPNVAPVWTKIAFLGGILIFPGMWSAILSSAFGSALGAPRVLQALSRDGLMPRFLNRTSKTGQPTIATWVAGGIALVAAVLLEDLNAIAELVTIFFLTLYLSINVVAAVERLVGDPSYRPTIRIPWVVSLLGALLNLAVMFLINHWACLIAIGLELLIWLVLRRRNLRASWGNVWVGFWGSLARWALYRLERQQQDPRSWRPHILLFANQVQHRGDLVRMTSWFNQNHGILTVCDVVEGNLDENTDLIAERQTAMKDFFAQQRIVAFGEVDVVRDYSEGLLNIVQANGMGDLRSNTVVVGWPRRSERLVSLLGVMRELHHMRKAGLIVRTDPENRPIHFKRIDVWWRGKYNNGDLMLLLAHLLKQNPEWARAEITIRSIVTSEAGRADLETSLTALIESVRIKADYDVIVKPENKSISDIMHEMSLQADVVFLGLMSVPEGDEVAYAERLEEIIKGLPTTVLVSNSSPFRGKLL